MTKSEWDIEHDIRRERLYACGMNWFDADVRARIEIETERGPQPQEDAA